MKKFKVKDFIEYNSPCFGCNNHINFKVGFINTIEGVFSYLPKPNVTPEYTEIDLLINWSSSLTLHIFHKTNKFSTNNVKNLTKYLEDHKLFLYSNCDRCYTEITSQCLNFNFENGLISAVGLDAERLMVSDKEFSYQISSFYSTGKSNLIVDRIDKVKPISPLIIELPLLPKSRFKNRQHFLNKIKTYITFS